MEQDGMEVFFLQAHGTKRREVDNGNAAVQTDEAYVLRREKPVFPKTEDALSRSVSHGEQAYCGRMLPETALWQLCLNVRLGGLSPSPPRQRRGFWYYHSRSSCMRRETKRKEVLFLRQVFWCAGGMESLAPPVVTDEAFCQGTEGISLFPASRIGGSASGPALPSPTLSGVSSILSKRGFL